LSRTDSVVEEEVFADADVQDRMEDEVSVDVDVQERMKE